MNKADKIKRTKIYKDIKGALLEQLERKGNDKPHFIDLVNDYMNLYITKEIAQADIFERGTCVEWKNSDSQYGYKKNDSVDQVIKINQQMLKILTQLGIEPDDFGEFDDDEL